MPRRLGQHFLNNEVVISKAVIAINPQKSEEILEVGPGHGELTLPLLIACAKQGAKLTVIERDSGLAKNLALQLKNNDLATASLSIIEGDVLEFIQKDLKITKIVGNIPYYVTGYLLRTIGDLPKKPEICVFMVQKEVAERICAAPPEMNRLAASIQFWATPRILASVPKSDFTPPPEVDSALILLETKKDAANTDAERYYEIVRALFAQPRKTILNNLAAGMASRDITKDAAEKIFASLGLKPTLRPQNLTIENISDIASRCG